jgi:hypothetical protein
MDALSRAVGVPMDRIPFLIYSGFATIDEGARREAPHVSKPAHPEMLVSTVAGPAHTPANFKLRQTSSI